MIIDSLVITAVNWLYDSKVKQ